MGSIAREGSGSTGAEAALRTDIKRFIVEHLKIKDADPAGIADESPLVGSGLDLDSIDLLELVTGIERRYGLRFEDPDLVRRVFSSVATIADHISRSRDQR